METFNDLRKYENDEMSDLNISDNPLANSLGCLKTFLDLYVVLY